MTFSCEREQAHSSVACKALAFDQQHCAIRAATHYTPQYLIGPWCSSSRTRRLSTFPGPSGAGSIVDYVALRVATTAATAGAASKTLFRSVGSLVDVVAHGHQHRGQGGGGAATPLRVLWLGRGFLQRGRPGVPQKPVADGASAGDVGAFFLEKFVRVL